ncbi:phage/plasmid primase, P4 family [Oscillibacter sp.]|uniref:phage/plasmid primase, P4 family n=1 Tax=Oscillibacter sp. TaxID=1945593 RepID=UPI001B421FF9|nr:phage/plasmid primase, P4 family [Oscillibacter sp.]MBP3509202.1 bifunctional DNA primase/polymerase [Oscillibacter sp.]
MESTMLRAALAYAKMGLAVIPLHTPQGDGGCSCGKANCGSCGKHPRTGKGSREATRDPEQIRAWWQQWPDANIGIATGRVTGLMVIDIDTRHQGDEYFPELPERYGELPETWEVQTGGGRHMYFRTPETALIRNRANWVQGVDVRGEGGYVVAPPSLHPSGRRYEWELSSRPDEIGLAELPPLWLGALASRPHESETPAKGEVQLYKEGGRNEALFRLASSDRAKGKHEAAILAGIMEVNRHQCIPPLEPEEVETIVRSACRYAPGKLKIGTEEGAEDLSDIGNARRLASMFKGAMVHVPAWGWTVWDGGKWQVNAGWMVTLKAVQMADALLQAACDRLDEANRSENDKARAWAEKVYAHARRSRQEARIKAAVNLAAPELHAEADEFDREPYDLNTPGGIIDLKTGKLRPHDPGARCTMMTAVTPRPGAMPLFGRFLERITCGDKALARYLQQVAGMAAVGKVYEEGIVICYGEGSNGKSTLLNLLARVLGEYAWSISPEILMAQRNGQQVQGVADIRGRRLVISQETEEGRRLSISTVKQLSSTDKIVAKRLYKDPEQFVPTHTLVMATNFLPKVGSLDQGTWRRLVVAPFEHRIPEDEKVPDFLDKLFLQEGAAVLAWMVEGARQFIANGHRLDKPQAVLEASRAYAAAENWVANFIGECCETGPGLKERGGRLYEAYKLWARDQGEYVRRNRDFAAGMEANGFMKKRTKNNIEWYGVRLTGDTLQMVAAAGSMASRPPF